MEIESVNSHKLMSMKYVIALCCHPLHLRRTLSITMIVGTWLTFYNQGDVLVTSGISALLVGKIFLNYLTPFIVANWGLLSRDTNQ